MRIQYTIWNLLLLTTNIAFGVWILLNFDLPWMYLEPKEAIEKAVLLGVMLGVAAVTAVFSALAMRKMLR
jgi:uncharacterized metal-binding protein